MKNLDLHNKLAIRRAISPVSVADNTALVSQIIDRQGFSALEFAIAIGAIADADATFAVLIEDGDAANLSDAAAVADALLIGTEAAAGFQFDDDNETRKIGYLDGQGDQQQFTDFRAFVRNGLTRIVPAPGHAWPATLITGGAVTLYADVGFTEADPAIPANLVHACRLLVGHFFTNREAAVIGTIATELPLAVANLLAPDRPRQL